MKKVVISLAAIGTTAAIFGAIVLACYMRRKANQKGEKMRRLHIYIYITLVFIFSL